MNTKDQITLQKPKERIAIIGGSFDPPTYHHLQMGAEIINLEYADKVWYIPCGTRPDKMLTKGELRYEMLKGGIDDFFWSNREQVEINDIELKNGALIPTYDQLVELTKRNPDNDLYFVMGTDLLYHYTRWEFGIELKQKFKFIIVDRPGHQDYPKENLPDSHQMIDISIKCEMSSTQLRNRIKKQIKTKDLGLMGLTTKKVIEVIKKNRLYIE